MWEQEDPAKLRLDSASYGPSKRCCAGQATLAAFPQDQFRRNFAGSRDWQANLFSPFLEGRSWHEGWGFFLWVAA